MKWALLWSQKQNCLHVEPLEETLGINRTACIHNRGGDYRILMIGDRSEVDSLADEIRPSLSLRERSRVSECL